MKDSEVYLRAAQRVFGQPLRDCYSCCAIDYISSRSEFSGYPQRRRYQALFMPEGFCSFGWADLWGHSGAAKSERVLALLFMHQIALDEERKS